MTEYGDAERVAILGAQLREMREAAGLSQAALAARIPYSRSALGHYETGLRIPTADIVLWYQRACGTTVDSVTAAATLAKADVEHRSFIAKATYSAALSATALTLPEDAERLASTDESRRVGMAEVRAVQAVTDAFHGLDEARGGGFGRSAVAEFLSTDVSTLLRSRFANADTARHAFSAAAELAYLAGFKAHDAGLDAMAQRYYLAALRLAQSGLPGHAGFALRILALQGVDIQQRTFSVALVEKALASVRGKIDGDAESLFTVALLRCHAEAGNRRDALAALRDLEPWSGTTVTTELPRYIEIWMPNKATVANQTAKSFVALGDTVEAERYFRKAASIWNPETHRRAHSIAVADDGWGLWQMGDEGGAVALWASIVPVLRDVQSVRTSKALERIEAHAPDLAS